MKSKMMKALHLLTYILVIVGALNWGLIAAFDFNLVTTLFGTEGMLTRVVYGLVGLSAVLQLVKCFTCKSCCSGE